MEDISPEQTSLPDFVYENHPSFRKWMTLSFSISEEGKQNNKNRIHNRFTAKKHFGRTLSASKMRINKIRGRSLTRASAYYLPSDSRSPGFLGRVSISLKRWVLGNFTMCLLQAGSRWSSASSAHDGVWMPDISKNISLPGTWNVLYFGVWTL